MNALKNLGHSDSIYHLDLTFDGNILSCSLDNTVKIWEIETGGLLKTFKFKDEVNCVKNLNNELIAVALENGKIQILNHKKTQIVKTITAHSFSSFYRLCLLSNGDLISGSKDGELKLWKILEFHKICC